MSKAAAFSSRLKGTEIRDARHDRGGPEVSGAPRKRKDTRRWCKGKVGVEHALAVRDARDMGKLRFSMTLIRFCTKCGKEIETWWRPRSYVGVNGVERTIGPRKPMPDWAREHLRRLRKACAGDRAKVA
jgi:hypothetical protein